MKTSYSIAKDLFLVNQDVPKAAVAKPVERQTNHVVMIDCSGSMSYDLPKIRDQIKRKLPKLLKDGDTVSVVWFSGRGQCGVLLEAEPVATLSDLKDVNAAVDRWLRPVGMTGFKEPFDEATKLVARVGKKHPGGVFSLFFMSDGCDNQWGRPEILKAVDAAAGGFSSATFVEYGYYADRRLLASMAERAGGQLIFAEVFDKYEPAFDAAMQKRPSGAKRVELEIEGDTIGGFAWTMSGGDITTYAVDGGRVSVPEGCGGISYLAPKNVGAPGRKLVDMSKEASERRLSYDALDAAYAAVSLFSVRMQPNVVYPILQAIGDVRLIDNFSGCFGKQKYSAFMDDARLAAIGNGRFRHGWDPKRVPREDAFTVLDLLRVMADDDSNRLMLDHPAFSYSRIGRGRVDTSENLTTDELEQIQQLTARIASERDPKKIGQLNDEIRAITDSKSEALKFVADQAPDGYPISSLTLNEDRPNVSVLVRKTGSVDVTARLTPALSGKIPGVLPTFVYRNYTIIKDGLVNVKVLPVKISDATMAEFTTAMSDGRMSPEAVTFDGDVALVNLEKLPVLNRQMVGSVSAKQFFAAQFELLRVQASQKVYNAYVKELLPAKKSDGFVASYGEDGAAWLKEQGFTDYSGFSPKSVQAESTDVYMAKELKTSVKGYSKLPTLKELREMVAKGKVNAPGVLMLPAVEEVDAFLASKIYTKAAAKDAVLESWLDGQATDAKKRTRGLIRDLAQTAFALIVGQVWFSEFASLDENTMIIEADDGSGSKAKIEVKSELREVAVKI